MAQVAKQFSKMADRLYLFCNVVKNTSTADGYELDGAIALLVLNKAQFALVQKIMTDGGYAGADTIIAKQGDLKSGQVTPQRWAVEHSFSRLERWYSLWFNCERSLNTSKTIVAMAFLVNCSAIKSSNMFLGTYYLALLFLMSRPYRSFPSMTTCFHSRVVCGSTIAT